jgi:hypothetical protein
MLQTVYTSKIQLSIKSAFQTYQKVKFMITFETPNIKIISFAIMFQIFLKIINYVLLHRENQLS